MIIDRPYFMRNEEWYYFDYNKGVYVLTDSAPSEAKKSYKAFYAELKDAREVPK